MSLVTSSPTRWKVSSDVLNHATSEIAIGSKLGIDATKKIAGEGFKREWPPLIRMDDTPRGRKLMRCSETRLDKVGQPCEYGSPYYEDNH